MVNCLLEVLLVLGILIICRSVKAPIYLIASAYLVELNEEREKHCDGTNFAREFQSQLQNNLLVFILF